VNMCPRTWSNRPRDRSFLPPEKTGGLKFTLKRILKVKYIRYNSEEINYENG